MPHQQLGLGALTASSGDTQWLWGQIWSKTRQLNFMSQTGCPCPLDTVNSQLTSSERINPGDSEAWHPICHVTTFSFLPMSHRWLFGVLCFISKLSSARFSSSVHLCPWQVIHILSRRPCLYSYSITAFESLVPYSPSFSTLTLAYPGASSVLETLPILSQIPTSLSSSSIFIEPPDRFDFPGLGIYFNSLTLPESPGHQRLTIRQSPRLWQPGREHAQQPANDTVFMEVQMGQVVETRGAGCRDYVRWDNLGCGQQQHREYSRV